MQANISVTFLLTSNTRFQDRHMHFCGIFAFSDVFLTKPSVKADLYFEHLLIFKTITIAVPYFTFLFSG